MAASALLLIACGGTDAPTPGPTQPPPSNTARVVITAPATSIALGDRLQLSSAVYLSGGQLSADAKPIWTISDSSRARVSATGVVSGFATGTVDVRADFLGTVGTFRVTLTPGTGAWGAGYTYGGSNNDGGDDVIADASGNLYVAGGTAGAVDGQSVSFLTGEADALVTRMLPNGKKAWTTLIPTRSPNSANGMALHKDGGVVVLSSNFGGSYITHVNASGRIVWETYLNGGVYLDVAADRAGNFYVTGTAIRQNGATICPGVPQPAPNGAQSGNANDGLLLKLAPDGRQLWCRLWTHVLADQSEPKVPVVATNGIAIVLDEARGGIYVGGWIQQNFFYGVSPFVRRFNLADGSSDWNRFINPQSLGSEPAGRVLTPSVAGLGVLHGLTIDGNGDVWAGVSEDSIGSNVDIGYSANIVKISATGTELLRRTVVLDRTVLPAVNRKRAVNAITYRASSNDIIAVASYGITNLGRTNYPNATVLAFDLSGREKWRQLITNAQPNFNPALSLRGLTTLPNGDIFLVGDTDFGPPPGYVDDRSAGAVNSIDILVSRITGRP